VSLRTYNAQAFSVFSVFFEVVSAYGNVGLSLGHPSNSTSLSGHFTVFSKVVICAMMIRGRHRGLPYALDRAITLPGDRTSGNANEEDHSDGEPFGYKDGFRKDGVRGNWGGKGRKIEKAYTQ
jgi:Trk-type K+ transport system membrane component